MNEGGHLRPEVIFGYRNRLLTAAELRGLDSHISGCQTCREELARQMDVPGMVAAFRESQRPVRRQLWIPCATAAAVLFAAGAFWFVKSNPGIPPETDLVDNALRSGRIALPDFVAGLAPRHEVLMGQPGNHGNETNPDLISPVATGVLNPRPVFRWRPLSSGAWKYSVRVYRSGSELQIAGPEVTDTEWAPDTDLPAGVDYEWQVTAVSGSERVTLPRPPQTPPRFRVVIFAPRIGSSHLALAVEYGRAGLIEDSRRELNEELRQHPQDAGARRLLDNLPK